MESVWWAVEWEVGSGEVAVTESPVADSVNGACDIF